MVLASASHVLHDVLQDSVTDWPVAAPLADGFCRRGADDAFACTARRIRPSRSSFAQGNWIQNVFSPKKEPPAPDPPDLGKPPAKKLPKKDTTVEDLKALTAAKKRAKPFLKELHLTDIDDSAENIGASINMAKQVVKNMNKVDDQVLASRAHLQEVAPALDAAELRSGTLELARVAKKVLSPDAALSGFNKAVQRLAKDRDLVRHDVHATTVVGQPYLKKAHLSKLALDAAEADAHLQEALKPVYRALRMVQNINTVGSTSQPFGEDLQAAPRAGQGERAEPSASTSSGCLCDINSRCAMRGQPFSWCRVPGTCLQDVQDPTGVSHAIRKMPPSTGTAGAWDYCVPLSAQKLENGASKTAHFNCRCAPRMDVMEKYAKDPFYRDEHGKFDVNLVPFKDRIAIEAMTDSKDGEGALLEKTNICAPTQSSGGLAVCPVAKDCTRVGAASGKGAMGTAGGAPSAWFTGVDGKSWDFCVPAKTNASLGKAAEEQAEATLERKAAEAEDKLEKARTAEEAAEAVGPATAVGTAAEPEPAEQAKASDAALRAVGQVPAAAPAQGATPPGQAAQAALPVPAVDTQGEVVAAAHGVPPAWIDDIPGAEAWAVFQAASRAEPGSQYRVDCKPCVDAFHKGREWATSDKRPHARVHALLFAALDSTPPEAMVWMPAHTTEADVGRAELGDGSLLSAQDRWANAEADKLAKKAVEQHRVPKHLRDELKKREELVESTARWVAMATWAAGSQAEFPFRDTDASRTAARRLPSEDSGAKRKQKSKVVVLRPVALGGHTLARCRFGWQCVKCKVRAKTYGKIAPRQCSGNATARWAEKAQELAGLGMPSAGGHTRVLSGELLWCTKCGAYASSVARGLAKPCPGKVQSSSRGGMAGQLRTLLAGKHPVTRKRLPEPLPEPAWGAAPHAKRRQLQEGSACGLQSSNLRPAIHALTADERKADILARVRAKELAATLKTASA
eukprot:TRINITY_DN65803_c0_g1_i3.p1 TRINITY_DN65803_c0_g1~~TRINITY_DN65803_c0_g1_i3.p1  ORF type:complete len:967 (+),score=210.69 TRINITY_DN65803_c0_g1_i3:52-2952(+)